MKVFVCFEAFYCQDIVTGSKQKAFFDEDNAKKYCKSRQIELDKKNNNNIQATYWKLDVV